MAILQALNPASLRNGFSGSTQVRGRRHERRPATPGAFHVEMLEGLGRPEIAEIAVPLEVGMPLSADTADLETDATGGAGCIAVEREQLDGRAHPRLNRTHEAAFPGGRAGVAGPVRGGAPR